MCSSDLDETTKISDLNPPLIIDKKIYENSYDEEGKKTYPELPVLYNKEKREITNLEYEEQINESKRNIKLLDVSQLSLIISLVESVFNE